MAVTVVFDSTNRATCQTIASAATGANLAGAQITATFSGGLTETVSMSATSATAASAVGTGWSLSVDGKKHVPSRRSTSSSVVMLELVVVDLVGPVEVLVDLVDVDFVGPVVVLVEVVGLALAVAGAGWSAS